MSSGTAAGGAAAGAPPAWMSDDYAHVRNPAKAPGHAKFVAADRRKSIEKLEESCAEAPSSSSRSKQVGNWHKKVHGGRPDDDQHNPEFPPEYYNPGFAKFSQLFRQCCDEPTTQLKYFQLVADLMAEPFANVKHREDELYSILRAIASVYGLQLPKRRRNHVATDALSGCRMDAVVVAKAAAKRGDLPYVFIEVKHEVGASGNAFEQSAAYAMHEFARMDETQINTWDMPCFIVSFAGPMVKIGAFWVGRFVNIVPLTPMIDMVSLRDTDRVIKVAAALQALFESCMDLDLFDPAERKNPEFPDVRFLATMYESADPYIEFTGAYKSNVLRASVNGKPTVIKADQITVAAHQAAGVSLGISPKILHVSDNGLSSWSLLWMEDWGYNQWTTLDNVMKKAKGVASFQIAPLTSMIRDKLQALLDVNLVYFDVRAPNTLVKARIDNDVIVVGDVALVDFELVGAPGAPWPPFDLNPEEVWPLGVRDTQVRHFAAQHMWEMLDILKNKLEKHNADAEGSGSDS